MPSFLAVTIVLRSIVALIVLSINTTIAVSIVIAKVKPEEIRRKSQTQTPFKTISKTLDPKPDDENPPEVVGPPPPIAI